MALKKYKPTTPWRRWMTGYSFEELTSKKPFKALTMRLKKHSWRNNTWRITVRHQGGWHAQRYRLVDFYYHDKIGIPAKVETIEYDPCRTAYIALICYTDWERRYIIAPKDLKVWDKVITDEKTKIKTWNRMKVWNIPAGMLVHNLEVIVWQWVASIRSAWTYWQLVSQDGVYTQIKMPSWEVRYIHKNCFASLWQVSNIDHNQMVIGKAWRSRHMWKRPTVLWKSMNPVDHPHGGWEGHSPLWMAPKTPWGQPALWVKTRSRKKTDRWLAKKRKK